MFLCIIVPFSMPAFDRRIAAGDSAVLHLFVLPAESGPWATGRRDGATVRSALCPSSRGRPDLRTAKRRSSLPLRRFGPFTAWLPGGGPACGCRGGRGSRPSGGMFHRSSRSKRPVERIAERIALDSLFTPKYIIQDTIFLYLPVLPVLKRGQAESRAGAMPPGLSGPTAFGFDMQRRKCL